MAIRLPPAALYLVAVIGAPVVYGAVAQLTYSLAAATGLWPSDVYWLLVIGALFGGGALVIARLPGLGTAWRIAMGGLYGLNILIPIAITHVFIACRNGDCF